MRRSHQLRRRRTEPRDARFGDGHCRGLQGTLHVPQANRNMRIENKISKDDQGNLKVVDYSIDQGGQPLVANKASFDGGVLTYSIDSMGPLRGQQEP